MERPDLRKEANDAIRGISGELRGAIVLATNCNKSSVCMGGEPKVLVNMLVQAMQEDPHIMALVHTALQVAITNMFKNN